MNAVRPISSRFRCPIRRVAVAEITFFVAMPFDLVDSSIAAGEPIDCPSHDAAIQLAQGLWKVFGKLGDAPGDRCRDYRI